MQFTIKFQNNYKVVLSGSSFKSLNSAVGTNHHRVVPDGFGLFYRAAWNADAV